MKTAFSPGEGRSPIPGAWRWTLIRPVSLSQVFPSNGCPSAPKTAGRSSACSCPPVRGMFGRSSPRLPPGSTRRRTMSMSGGLGSVKTSYE